jgi:dolichol-phosphate mannosyltransferase
MKFTAYTLGFNLIEVPIIFINRVEGVSKMSSGIFEEALFGVIQLKWNSLFKRVKGKR